MNLYLLVLAIKRRVRNFLRGASYTSEVLRKDSDQQLLELDLTIEVPWSETRNYKYSKLYFRAPGQPLFSEEDVVCFRVLHNGKRDRLRIALPERLRQYPEVEFRVDALPYAAGSLRVHAVRLVDPATDDAEAAMLTRNALLLAQEEQRRQQLELRERQQRDRTYASEVLRKYSEQQLLELDLTIEIPWSETRNYEYSKLYFRAPGQPLFSEEDVVCFRVLHNGKRDRLRIALPERLRQYPEVEFRVDALPYAAGSLRVHAVRLVDPATDDAEAAMLTRNALLLAQEEQRRQQLELRERQQRDRTYASEVLRKYSEQQLLELDLTIEIPWSETRNYEYSKLYFRAPGQPLFSEEDVVCFRVLHNGKRDRLRIALPERLRQYPEVEFRVDALPYAAGSLRVHAVRLVDPATDDAEAAMLTRNALLLAHKEWVRQEVEVSERKLRIVTPHYPESLGLELTPNCNLTCGHCSSHGTPQLHRAHNKMRAMGREMLAKLADEVFPHLTVISVVGRGESTMVSNALWADFVQHVRTHQVYVSLVTNAYDLKRKITTELVPHIDTLTISIDGITASTFATNRGGASIEHTIKEIAYFHNLRRAARLARRPKLCLSWTLKRNNIAEFPEFIRIMAAYEPDLIYARHLLVFHEKDRSESLLDMPETANTYLAEAYALMRQHGIRSECPPLFDLAASATTSPKAQAAAPIAQPTVPVEAVDPSSPERIADRCIWFHRTGAILASGQVSTCGRHYAATAGSLATAASFMDVWNGPEMRGVRAAFGTTSEWNQCSNCWYRESRYDVQRAERAKGSNFTLDSGSRFSSSSWDFRGFESGSGLDPVMAERPLVFARKVDRSLEAIANTPTQSEQRRR